MVNDIPVEAVASPAPAPAPQPQLPPGVSADEFARVQAQLEAQLAAHEKTIKDPTPVFDPNALVPTNLPPARTNAEPAGGVAPLPEDAAKFKAFTLKAADMRLWWHSSWRRF